jgi:hypothetical protein
MTSCVYSTTYKTALYPPQMSYHPLPFSCTQVKHNEYFHIFHSDTVFPEVNTKYEDMKNILQVRCGQGKQWEPSVVPECIDYR